MERILLKISIIILFFILLSSEVYAISLGSIVKEDYVEISNDESVKFKMLFWNIDSESYTLKLSVKDAPENWIAIIDPDEFVLNNSIGEEYISLPYMNDNIKAKVVNLFVKPDSDSEAGIYSVVIEAGTKTSDETSGIEIVPQRLFNFQINLSGSKDSIGIENKDIKDSTEFVSEEGSLKTISSAENELDKDYFYLAVVILVILASIIIYRKS
ncbi:MAG: hypothetical protein ABIE55_02030 [Candidatus Aenigmatarchaeota archaeon]